MNLMHNSYRDNRDNEFHYCDYKNFHYRTALTSDGRFLISTKEITVLYHY